MRDFVFASVWGCVDRWCEEKGFGVCVCIIVASFYHGQCFCGSVLFVYISV